MMNDNEIAILMIAQEGTKFTTIRQQKILPSFNKKKLENHTSSCHFSYYNNNNKKKKTIGISANKALPLTYFFF